MTPCVFRLVRSPIVPSLLRYPRPFCRSKAWRLILVALGCAIGVVAWPDARAEQAPGGPPSMASNGAQQRRLVQFLRKRLPDATQDVIDKTAGDFLAHLREASTMAVERFENGSMEDDELQSRVDVFVADSRVESDEGDAYPGAAPPPVQLDAAASEQIQQQEVAELLRKRFPGAPKDEVDKAARDFLAHLRETSPMAADRFAIGRMDDDDLGSRLDVFLGDHPELSGGSTPGAAATLRMRVAELLRREPGPAQPDSDRLEIADQFIRSLGDLSETTRDNLLSGRVSDDELQSRVTVFAADRRVGKTRVATDPAVAAVPAFVDAFEKANFGIITERADSICFRGTVDESGTRRELVIFKKRPNKLRIHVVEGGLVVGVIGFDGTSGWRQPMGKPARRIVGQAAAALAESARFDDPIVGYAERGASARLEGKPGDSPIVLDIAETDGTKWIETIDPANYEELSLVKVRKDGRRTDTKFMDYRKVGNLNVAFGQEEWADGVLRSTTRVTDVSLDPGLLDRFFSYPASQNLGYMDYMGGLAVLQAREKAGMIAKPQAAGSQP